MNGNGSVDIAPLLVVLAAAGVPIGFALVADRALPSPATDADRRRQNGQVALGLGALAAALALGAGSGVGQSRSVLEGAALSSAVMSAVFGTIWINSAPEAAAVQARLPNVPRAGGFLR